MYGCYGCPKRRSSANCQHEGVTARLAPPPVRWTVPLWCTVLSAAQAPEGQRGAQGRNPAVYAKAEAMPGTLLSLYINNKAGGLIFHRDFSSAAAKLDVNDHLRLASTFHGLALIMQQLSPLGGNSSGMELLEADGFVLQSMDTLTGLKFFVSAEPDSKNLEHVLKEVYSLYSDYAPSPRDQWQNASCLSHAFRHSALSGAQEPVL